MGHERSGNKLLLVCREHMVWSGIWQNCIVPHEGIKTTANYCFRNIVLPFYGILIFIEYKKVDTSKTLYFKKGFQ